MLIQPFIKNAFWHGSKAGNKSININVDFKKADKEVFCFIEDNGMGIEASLKNKQKTGSQHISVRIANIKNRIQLLNEKYGLQSLSLLMTSSICRALKPAVRWLPYGYL